MDHPSPIRRIACQKIHEGRVFRVISEHIALPSGREQRLDLVIHPGAVAIAARDGAGRLAVVRQYRRAAEDYLVELPAGRLEPGEAPLAAARRELEEETGLVAERWSPLTRFFAAPGFCSEELHLFLAEGLAPRGAGALAPDPDEELELLWRTPAQLLAEARDAKTLLAAALLSLP